MLGKACKRLQKTRHTSPTVEEWTRTERTAWTCCARQAVSVRRARNGRHLTVKAFERNGRSLTVEKHDFYETGKFLNETRIPTKGVFFFQNHQYWLNILNFAYFFPTTSFLRSFQKWPRLTDARITKIKVRSSVKPNEHSVQENTVIQCSKSFYLNIISWF